MTEKDGLVRHTKLATVSADGKRIEMNRSIENLTPLKLEAGVKDREYMVQDQEILSHLQEKFWPIRHAGV